MSETVRDRLVRGMAAARTGQPEVREEARLALEWVLRQPDADPDQMADAWWWLSRIEEEPGKRRLCLESLLALDPGNSAARQELAILDGRLKAGDVVDPNQAFKPVLAAEAVPSAGVHRYVCARCGGSMSFDAGRQVSVCSYCGGSVSQEHHPERNRQVPEQDFAATLPTAGAHLWELPAERALKCDSCGARFALPPLQVSGACPFCRSAQIVTASAGELIRPAAVLPFQIDGAAATRIVQAWLERQRFLPGDLARCAEFAQPRAVYLPFWTFDLGGTMTWRAMVARRHGRRTEWVPREGVYLVYHDDLLVPASRSLPEDLADGLMDFRTDALIPYAIDLLADCAAEIYQIPLDKASVTARQRALQIGREHEQKTSLAGESYRDFVMNSLGMTVDSFKLVLLPLWIGAYTYRGNPYRVFVNGATGTTAGRVPRSGLQKALAGLFGAERGNQAAQPGAETKV